MRSMRLEGESRENEHAVGVNAPESSWPLFAMGREICNPMNSIISMTSILLRDETLTSDQREFVESIKVSSDALMRVLNDIIDLSKLESEKLTLNIHPFSLRSLVEETLSSISIDAARKGLVLSHRFNGAVPDDILQDKMRLEQVIFNLLDSAVKCTDSGEIRLNISCQGGKAIWRSIFPSWILVWTCPVRALKISSIPSSRRTLSALTGLAVPAWDWLSAKGWWS